MQIVQLFVDGEQVDMFKDESITISDSIANVKDISKIYTAYSRQFTLPASPTNNRIFKHYYNFNIVGNTFDARYKVDAYLNVNGIRYKDGKLRLSGVKLKDNSPESYQVTFFGNAVALKDLFGEDTLSMLTGGSYGLNNYNHLYNNLTIRRSFNNSVQIHSGNIKYSFISHSRPFRYTGTDIVSDYNGETGLDTYLGLSDLKPSLKLKAIVDAIEEKYDLTFSQDFFNTTYFKNLYMWLHKEAGVMTQTTEQNELKTYFSDTSTWTLTSGTDFRDAEGGLFVFNEPYPNFDYVKYEILTYDVTFAGGFSYDFAITDSGSPLYNSSATGSFTFNINQELQGSAQTYFLEFLISSQSLFSPTQEIQIKKYTKTNYTDNWVDAGTSVYNASAIAVTSNLDVPDQMPEMKVYDFVINLFKMHQLTASIDKELNGDETVNVLPLQDYQSTGVTHDITENIDVTSTQVDRLIPYKEINFSYKGRKSAAISAYDQAYPNNKFGDLNWNAGTEDMDGGNYSVALDFEHMYFERILSSGGTPSTVQYGVMIDQDLEPIVGMPLIHCIVLRATNTPRLKWNNGDGTQFTLTAFNAPTNIDANGDSIHWGAQIDEYTAVQQDESLYNRFYFDSISSVFQQAARKITYKAYLPLGLLLSYNLNDRFRIGQNTYKIESVNTNLLNEESKLVLYNDLPPAVNVNLPENINQKTDLAKPENVQLVTPTSSKYRKIQWKFVSGATEYLLYLNGRYHDSIIPSGALIEDYEYTGLDIEDVNVLGVQAYYGTVGALSGLASIIVSVVSDAITFTTNLEELQARTQVYENEPETIELLRELNLC